MEKRVAHYDLAEVQGIVAKRGADAFTRAALMGMDAMALTQAQGYRWCWPCSEACCSRA